MPCESNSKHLFYLPSRVGKAFIGIVGQDGILRADCQSALLFFEAANPGGSRVSRQLINVCETIH
jgi:hypothetical protein